MTDRLAKPITSGVKVHRTRLKLTDHTIHRGDGIRHTDALQTFFDLAKQGEDICFVNVDFGVFADLIPDLRSLTPAQRLTREIKAVAAQQ